MQEHDTVKRCIFDGSGGRGEAVQSSAEEVQRGNLRELGVSQ